MLSQLAKITSENADQLQVVGMFEGHTAPILSIDIAPGGQLLASGSMDGTVRIWNLAVQEQVSILARNAEKEEIPRVAFSPKNPDHLAAAIGRKPFWETSNLMDHVSNLMSIFPSSSEDNSVWRLWSLKTGTVIPTRDTDLWGTSGLAYSRDGHWLAVMGSVFDITREPYSCAARLTQNRVRDVAFSDDGQLLALSTFYEKHPENYMCHFVEIYRVSDWRKVAEIEDSSDTFYYSAVRFLPNSHELLVKTSRDDTTRGNAHKLYRFKGARFEESTQVLSDVACFACHPDASIIAAARHDGHIVLLDWNRRKPVATVRAYQPAKPVRMPRGILTGLGVISRITNAMKSQYRASADMVFSQDGKRLISADGDRVIRLWGIPA